MKKIRFLSIILLISGVRLFAAISLDDFLNGLDIKEIRVLEKEFIYDQIYEVMFDQPVDHHNPAGAKFQQRLYISHIDPSLPVVLVTEGYSAKYYYSSEIARELKCNQIIVEHRYFGRSVPEDSDYKYLDTWQAASDHHRIIEIFKEFYPAEWITTGISKGGQTVMFHSYYFPDDADVRVPYVAPLNYSIEDPRIYEFLDHVGSKRERHRIYRFQKMMLKHQERYIPEFKGFSDEKGYTYNYAGGLEKAYEYCVLEYSFAFWQWGYVPVTRIPGKSTKPEEAIEHMNKVAGFDYFSDQFIAEYRPFFYQALTEMGYYGYDLSEFEKFLDHVDNPVFTFTIPEHTGVSFNADLLADLDHFIRYDAGNFIFIYGQNDTWTATGVSSLPGETNSRVFVKPDGTHRTRINNMPEELKLEIYKTLRDFLKN